MILWHPNLIPYLPLKRLASLHRDVCLCRGKGWGKGGVNCRYIWTHGYTTLVAYHILVLQEMHTRNWKPDPSWYNPRFRGKSIEILNPRETTYGAFAFPEHDTTLLIQHERILLKLLTRKSLWKNMEAENFMDYLGRRLKHG